MPIQTKLPDYFLRITTEDRATIWINLTRVATISILYDGPRKFGGFLIELPESEEKTFAVRKPEEVKALAKLLGFNPG